jgi:hypothetical protein
MEISAENPDYIATSGWTTSNLLEGINFMLNEEKSYNLVSILIGVNNQYQGIDIDFYEPDLRKIIDMALDVVGQDTSRVFILSIPDYAYTPFGNGNSFISQGIDNYNRIKRTVAAEYGIAFIDITPISRNGLSNTSLVATDGLHPSGEQYRQWVVSIIPSLNLDVSVFNPGSQSLPENNIWIYPNPAGTQIHVDSSLDIERISIFNLHGSIVSELMITEVPAMIDLSHLEPGVYTLWAYHPKEADLFSIKTIIVQPV